MKTVSKRFDMLLFPGGKSRAFTMSYDDGVVQDRRLAPLLREYGIKCTFNLGAGLLGCPEPDGFPGKPDLDISKVRPEEVPVLYAGHEIGGHGLYHSGLNTVGSPLAAYEIVEDKRCLEQLTGQPLRMFAYPFGVYDQKVMDILRLAGYQGARTVVSTGKFDLPEDFMQWNPTCHHNDPGLMDLAHDFVEKMFIAPALFYVWGHAYEFDGDGNWQLVEQLGKFISHHGDKIWFATNGEIIRYVTAWRRLEYSVDGTVIYNPSALDVMIRADRERRVVLKAGQYTRID